MKESKSKVLLRNLAKYGLPVVLSVWLFYYLWSKIDIDQMMQAMSRCNYWWIIGALVVSIFSHIFRAMRWRIQLDALDIRAPLAPLVWSIFGTYAINLIFPRLGEVWRTGYIAQRQRAPFTVVFGSMVADRLADTVTVLLLTVVTFLLARNAFMAFTEKYPQVYEGIQHTVSSPWLWVAGIVAVGLIVWLFASKSQNKWVLKVRHAVLNLWQGFAAVASMPGKGRWLFLTFCIWGCYFLQLYLAFFAFPFTEALGFVCALVAFDLSSISMGIPTNGGLGAWHMAIIFALGIYGVAFDPAAAFAMIVWGSQTALLVLLGIFTFVAIALDRRKSASVAR